MVHRIKIFALSSVAAVLALATTAAPLVAADGANPVISTQNRTIKGERYIPGISITPDGCEVWVMDDGVEGYAEARMTRDGRPVCRDVNLCGVINTDQYFASDSARIARQRQSGLASFFQASDAFGFIIIGHTDARASQEYNQRLSRRRADAVAKIAKATGVRVIDVRGYGEAYPKATNKTSAGMAQNRRVEILCVR